MKKLKLISIYILLTGYLSIELLVEFDFIQNLSYVPILLILLGTSCYIYADTKIASRLTKKSIAFSIFTISTSAIYLILFIFTNSLEMKIGDLGSMILTIIFFLFALFSMLYLAIYSKLVRHFIANLF